MCSRLHGKVTEIKSEPKSPGKEKRPTSTHASSHGPHYLSKFLIPALPKTEGLTQVHHTDQNALICMPFLRKNHLGQ